ncbi:MAG: FadR/GntR family transcriptional regulator [Anaerolineaceae bacterium]
MMEQPFQRVSTSRVSEAIVEQIRQAILDGQFQPGDRLPSQRELAKMFGVGRSALLEAIRILEQSGLLTIRTGGNGGAFVTAPSIRQVSDSLDLLFRREGATREELAEFRIVLECYCCKMAAEKASEEELNQIELEFNELKELAEKGSAYWQTFLTREIEFHFSIASLAHNRVSLAVLHSLATWLHSFSSQIPEFYKGRMLNNWQAIIAALRNRDGEQAQRLLNEHIYFFNLMRSSTE